MKYSEKYPIAELMHKDVETCRETTPAAEVFERMQRGNYRHMPVMSGKGSLVGIVSDRDLRNVLVFVPDLQKKKEVVSSNHLTVDKIMTRKPFYLNADDTVRTAVKLMVKHKVGCLPVLDDDEKLVGILTETDMLKLLMEILLEN